MDFKSTFESLKDRATDLAQAGVAQSRRLAEIAKLKMANMSEEDAIKKAYLEIGKLYYAEQGAAPDGAYAAACERITASKAGLYSGEVDGYETVLTPSMLEDLSLEEVIEAGPEFIFVTTMGSSSQKALDALRDGIQSNPAWASLSAMDGSRRRYTS